MMPPASPWDALLRFSTPIRATRPTSEPPRQQEDTKLARLLAELSARDSATTLTLSVCCDLSSRQVWGLLKAPRAAGQVSYSEGRWTCNRDWRGAAVERAAALLRAHGWQVQAPGGTR